MSRPTLSRSDRVAQMTKQEELIAKKRQEILEKQRTVELAKAVAAAQNSVAGKTKTETKPELTNDLKPKPQNNFCNDGSFLTHFKKILESTKKEREVKIEKDEAVDQAGSENCSVKSDKEENNTSTNESDSLKAVIDCPKLPDMSTPPPAPAPASAPAVAPAPTPSPTAAPGPAIVPNNSSMHSAITIPPPVVTVPVTAVPPTVVPPAIITPPSVAAPPPPPPSVFYPPPTIPPVSNTNSSAPYTSPSNMPNPPNIPIQFTTPPPQSTSFPPPPYFNPNIPPPILNTSAPPPPPPPPSTLPVFLIPPPEQMQLNNIPPPEPIQLSNIPPPKELDLDAIPDPEINLDAIKVPDNNSVFSDNNEQFLPTTLESLIELVAEKGDAYEDNIRTRKNDVHPSLWFLFDKESDAYIDYRNQVLTLRQTESNHSEQRSDEKYDPESVCEYQEDSDDEYMKDMMDRNFDNLKRKLDSREDNNDYSDDDRDSDRSSSRQRKRKSRWGGKVEATTASITAVVQTTFGNQNKPLLSAIQRTDPALLQYARQNYGTTNLSEEDWRKCEEHFKVNLLYQDMMKKREEIDRLAKSGKFRYEYDSDEDTTGGTWEHKLRTAEMEATKAWADALTRQSEGKHHIGDFLPPEELKKFMEKYDAKKNNRQPDLSDYKEYKLKEDNIGFQMLQKLGWKEGQGLGASGEGIVDPVNKAPQRDANQGLGAGTSSNPDECDNEYEAYRKRMMLAYRFRPNPLNNPRRAYY